MKKAKTSLKKQLYKAFTESINDWEIDDCYASHLPSGTSFWIRNGFSFFTPSGNRVEFGLFYKLKLWFWLKDCAKIKLIEKVSIYKSLNNQTT
jgi:hypothetical protein